MVSRSKKSQRKIKTRRKHGKYTRGGGEWFKPWTWFQKNPEENQDQTEELKPEELKPEELKPEELKPEELKPEELKSEEIQDQKPTPPIGGWRHGKKKFKEHSVSVNRKKTTSKSRSRSR